jgi:hypothetical protein
MVGLQAAELPSVDETAITDTATSPPKPKNSALTQVIDPRRPGLRFRGFSRPAVFGALGQVLIIGSDIEHLLFEDRALDHLDERMARRV